MQTTPAASPTKVRRFPYWPYALGLTFIALFALAPIISMLIATSIANAHGCQLDEGGVHPCVIGGTDRGETLGTMFVLCWFMFFTIPAGAIAFLAGLIAALIHHARWRRKQRAAAKA